MNYSFQVKHVNFVTNTALVEYTNADDETLTPITVPVGLESGVVDQFVGGAIAEAAFNEHVEQQVEAMVTRPAWLWEREAQAKGFDPALELVKARKTKTFVRAT